MTYGPDGGKHSNVNMHQIGPASCPSLRGSREALELETHPEVCTSHALGTCRLTTLNRDVTTYLGALSSGCIVTSQTSWHGISPSDGLVHSRLGDQALLPRGTVMRLHGTSHTAPAPSMIAIEGADGLGHTSN